MDIRQPANPRDFEAYTTQRIREEFLVSGLFVPGSINLTYSFIDRMIVGGICPDKPLTLEGSKEMGTDYFLQRRELGVINVGPAGSIQVDGETYPLDKTLLPSQRSGALRPQHPENHPGRGGKGPYRHTGAVQCPRTQ
jgi:4-deoxy-L-threo-5-hexosulose-uronate ketol-isomerase